MMDEILSWFGSLIYFVLNGDIKIKKEERTW